MVIRSCTGIFAAIPAPSSAILMVANMSSFDAFGTVVIIELSSGSHTSIVFDFSIHLPPINIFFPLIVVIILFTHLSESNFYLGDDEIPHFSKNDLLQLLTLLYLSASIVRSYRILECVNPCLAHPLTNTLKRTLLPEFVQSYIQSLLRLTQMVPI